MHLYVKTTSYISYNKKTEYSHLLLFCFSFTIYKKSEWLKGQEAGRIVKNIKSWNWF